MATVKSFCAQKRSLSYTLAEVHVQYWGTCTVFDKVVCMMCMQHLNSVMFRLFSTVYTYIFLQMSWMSAILWIFGC